MDKNNSFGNKLKYLRNLKGLTQAQLAELAGVHEKHISKLEIGFYKPNYETLQKVYKALEIEDKDIDTYLNKISENDNPYYMKSLLILNKATAQELEFYYGVLKQLQKGMETLKNK